MVHTEPEIFDKKSFLFLRDKKKKKKKRRTVCN